MMASFRGTLLAACAIAVCAPSHARPTPTTWAKPGVSFAEYRQDAADCANNTRATAVAIRPDTLRHLSAGSMAVLITLADQFQLAPESSALTRLQGLDQFQSETDIARRSYNFGAEYVRVVRRDVRFELQSALDACLIGRGYARIRLMPDQEKTLSDLKQHSAARAHYLHMIASAASPPPQQP